MRVWLALAVAAVASGAVGCVPAAHSPLRAASHAGGELPRGARARFEPERFDAVFQGAIRAVRARGWAIASCDPVYGAIATATTETDAPCGASTCLARDMASVKLGFRRARVTLTREVWDATLRAWQVPDDPRSVAAIDREEREIVQEAVRAELEDGAERAGGACGPSVCDPGPCVASASPRS
jgi:hypothetical protein